MKIHYVVYIYIMVSYFEFLRSNAEDASLEFGFLWCPQPQACEFDRGMFGGDGFVIPRGEC